MAKVNKEWAKAWSEHGGLRTQGEKSLEAIIGIRGTTPLIETLWGVGGYTFSSEDLESKGRKGALS